MKTLKRLLHLTGRGPRLEEGVSWEIAHHLEERIDELMAGGLSNEAAREEAYRTFGDVKRIEAEVLRIDRRAAKTWMLSHVLDDLAQDVRYAARSLRSNASVAWGVILTLGLGIGANAAMFSVMDALMLRPLPYTEPNELVHLMMLTPSDGTVRPNIPYAVARSWKETQEGPTLLHARASVLLTGGSEARTAAVQAVTPEFTQVFGVEPAIGRGFAAEDAQPGAPSVALLDHAIWWQDFGARLDILGGTLTLNGIEHTIIGVMPEGFRFPTYATTAAWVAMRTDGVVLGRSVEGSYIEAAARVPESEQAAINAQAATTGRQLFQGTDPASEATLGIQSMNEGRGGGTREAVLLLSGAVFLILLVAGLNMVNLLLARGSARTDELAIRKAVGASRARIIRQIWTEAMLLALIGGVVAVLIAFLVLRAIHGIIPSSVTFWAPHAIAIEERTLLFTFVVAVCCGLLFGLLPAWSAADWVHPNAREGLTRYATSSRRSRDFRRGLVIAEIGFSVLLLVTASLLINSLVRLVRVEPGMRLQDMAVLQFAVPSSRYPPGPARSAYLGLLEDRLTAVPGVEAVTLTAGLPPNTGFLFGFDLEPEGGISRPLAAGMVLPNTTVGPEFFSVTGARLIAGRAFQDGEDSASRNVIIDVDLAEHLWQSPEEAVGRRFRLESDADWLTVIGVMADLKLMGPDERRGEFSLLYPIASYERLGGQLAMAIRTGGDPGEVLDDIRAAVREVDPDQPIQELVPATTYYATAVEMPRFLAVLIGILAALAVALAAVGIHGVLTFGAAQRRREFGVRLALGARASSLGGLVLTEGVKLAVVGSVLGVTGALLTTRLIGSVLYEIDALDPPTFTAASFLVLLITIVASLRAALHAARVDPVEALRV